ncbi:MAG: class I mannose-6-phosphate isomerase [Lewinellaceae bacterium]|nr:class I mannose-6-phosphate isomerase [Lewinellaceae bacterium]MCB9285680.1 class I mannose-6-phosphate isomerase [Lewinellaceae bacterium]
MQSNYDKFPVVKVPGFERGCFSGWEAIAEAIRQQLPDTSREKAVLVVECYHGVEEQEARKALLERLRPVVVIEAEKAYLSEEQLDELTFPDVTDDRIFGFMTRLTIDRFFDPGKLEAARRQLRGVERGLVLVLGVGAAHLAEKWDVLAYADMARWEIQQRMRRHEVANLGATNFTEDFARQYKRAYFVDWRVCDRVKKQLLPRSDFLLDTNKPGQPKMVSGEALLAGLKQAICRPFRVAPFFDPGPWGGQWMKKVCGLDPSLPNYAWCFDCVPEENSLLLGYGEAVVEIPSVNLVFFHPEELLGGSVYSRFGPEFPIRFDFLDTMGGGNLSLQVHPLTEYIQEHFGMHYTQDESYYLLDAGEEAFVYLGLKEGIDKEAMIKALQDAQNGGAPFEAEQYVEKWPVRKHDHFLIPAGTVHCSGKDSMVLEISATPYIFTFKLWDWGRLGLDGKPRPINIEHGRNVIQWQRDTSWVGRNLVNRIEPVAEGKGWREEKTGLHKLEFIESRRHWFTGKVDHHTGGGVNVLNLVEGREAIVESPDGAFEPFVVHYAETFIVPAAVGAYSIRPYGESEGKECATIKAFVRT